MIALNITTSLRGDLDDRAQDVQACAEKWWVISDATLNGYADQVLAVADNVIVGVFDVLGWDRDQASSNKVVFDLKSSSEWQWVIGQDSPVTWTKGQANPVRKLGTVHVTALRTNQPIHQDAGQGWSLDVAPDGTSATVRGPGQLVVTSLNGGQATVATAA
jgi:hypothetical protein